MHLHQTLCIDCQIPIAQRSTRCYPCKVKQQTLPPKLCVDCGIRVDRRSDRCPACRAVTRRNPIRMCPSCGVLPCKDPSRWCWECSYIQRGKRSGKPMASCSTCGTTLSRKGKHQCKTCRSATKEPPHYCPDCGREIQRHVARCRACTGISQRVRTAADLTYGFEWPAQRRLALRNGGGICQFCQGKANQGVRLHVHHIVPWRVTHDSGPPNLVVVCRPCHGALHAHYRAGRCKVATDFTGAYSRFRLTDPKRLSNTSNRGRQLAR